MLEPSSDGEWLSDDGEHDSTEALDQPSQLKIIALSGTVVEEA